jgi:CMP-N-acetylneuraminic acid synthetase
MDVCVIPAKFGSSRLPEKNFIKFFHELNLTEILLLKLKLIQLDAIIVSSENITALENLRFFCKSQSISNVKFHLREDYLAKDPSTITDVVEAAISCQEFAWNSNCIERLIVCLPTSPMTKTVDIENVLKLVSEHPKHRILSVSESSKPPFNAWSFEPDGKSLSLTFPSSKYSTTQSTRCPNTFLSNGAISGWNLKNDSTLTRKVTIGYKMTAIQAFDIDTTLDFELSQYVFGKYFDWSSIKNET